MLRLPSGTNPSFFLFNCSALFTSLFPFGQTKKGKKWNLNKIKASRTFGFLVKNSWIQKLFKTKIIKNSFWIKSELLWYFESTKKTKKQFSDLKHLIILRFILQFELHILWTLKSRHRHRVSRQCFWLSHVCDFVIPNSSTCIQVSGSKNKDKDVTNVKVQQGRNLDYLLRRKGI